MRRKEKEIKDQKTIDEIIKKAIVCRIAMCDDGMPYLVPVNFGYRDNAIYIHTAYEGKKIDILRKNNRVCFEIESDIQLVSADAACDWGTLYTSVIGFGRAQFIEDEEGKREGLEIIVRHYTDQPIEFKEKGFRKALVIKIEIESLTGKSSRQAVQPSS